MNPARSVLVTYAQDHNPRRASGWQLRNDLVLTADHCATGSGYTVWCSGQAYSAKVVWRSGTSNVDLALLQAPELPHVSPASLARLDRSGDAVLSGATCLCFPSFTGRVKHADGASAGDDVAAHLSGSIPLGHGHIARAAADGSTDLRVPLVIDSARSSLPHGTTSADFNRAWSSASGGGVVVTTASREFCVGVVSAREAREATNTLKISTFDLIDRLAPEDAAKFWELCGVTDPSALPTLGGSSQVEQVVMGTIPQRAPEFVTRAVLDQLVERLDHSAPVPAVSLCGLRGVGKSQVAAGVARHCTRQGWAVVAWIEADSRERIVTGLSLLADRLGLSNEHQLPEVSAAHLISAWNSDESPQRLVVLDNLVNPDHLVGLLPQEGSATVVVTTADRGAAIGEALNVGPFTADQARNYLQVRTTLRDTDGAGAVGHELGWLPLALASAAWTIDRRRRVDPNYGYRDYAAELDIQPLDKMLPRERGALDYPHSAVTALALAMQTALDAAPDKPLARQIIGALSYLDPNGVRRAWLDTLGTRFDVDETLMLVADSALAQPSETGTSLIMHRLVARVARRIAERDGWAEVAKTSASLVLEKVPLLERGDYWDRRSEASELAAHVQRLSPALVTRGDVRDVVSAGLASGQKLSELGDVHKAIAILTSVEEVAGSALGPNHPDTLGARGQLAGAYGTAGDPARAILLYEQTLVDLEQLLGPDHPATLTLRSNLAGAYYTAGDLDRALRSYEQIVSDLERVLGTDHVRTLAARTNFAYTSQAAGKVSRAIALFEEVLDNSRRVLGPEHPHTLLAHGNLAGAYQTAGDRLKALSMFEQGLLDRERVFGRDHPHSLAARNDLAYSTQAVGHVSRAIVLYEQVLVDRKRVLGPNHPHTLTSQSNLAGAYQAAGDLAQATRLYEENLMNRERTLGLDHPDRLIARNNLAGALRASGDLTRAVSLFEQAAADFDRVLGPRHPHTLTAICNLADAYHAADDTDRAAPLFEQVLADRERILGSDHPDTLASRNYTALALLSDASGFARALDLAGANVEACHRLFGPDDARTLDCRCTITRVLLASGRRVEGIGLLRDLVVDCERALGDHQVTRTAHQQLLDATPPEHDQ